jgi:glycosyltransferase involved in cell wall biosynthesis
MKAELFLAKNADRVVVVTEVEREELLTRDPSLDIVVLPNIHPLPDFASLPTQENRRDLLFVGSFDHAPNEDAVLYFCTQILPLITSQLPSIVFNIVGSNMPSNVRALQGPNINPIGYVEDLRRYFDRSLVFVAPLRYGAGLKGKVGQSMSFGVPVVGTSIAFEGFSAKNRKHGLIADDPISFAQATVDLSNNTNLWQQISYDAWSLIDLRFSPQAVGREFQDLLSSSLN